ncbi:hypothetical protein AXA44_39815 [Rhodococcus sp. SC4]|nr:hypothetical protein AXA44_39815 [Rhodococcus sp. SC4]
MTIGQRQAIMSARSVPWGDVAENLHNITTPVLYANGMPDVMIHSFASYAAVEHRSSAELVLCSGTGHPFLFPHLNEPTDEVKRFLDN